MLIQAVIQDYLHVVSLLTTRCGHSMRSLDPSPYTNEWCFCEYIYESTNPDHYHVGAQEGNRFGSAGFSPTTKHSYRTRCPSKANGHDWDGTPSSVLDFLAINANAIIETRGATDSDGGRCFSPITTSKWTFLEVQNQCF